jgi:AcrR family transcriptional regulator
VKHTTRSGLGRPRDDSRDEAILDAVLDVLADQGYSALTMDGVAGRARAGKATIYRRWRGKADLVIDAMSRLGLRPLEVPDTGSVREDLVGFGLSLADLLSGRLGRVATAVVGELPRSADLAAAFRRSFWAGVQAGAGEILTRGVERGQVHPTAPLDLLRGVIASPFILRLMITGEPLDEPFVTRLVDQVLMPLLTAGRPAG